MKTRFHGTNQPYSPDAGQATRPAFPWPQLIACGVALILSLACFSASAADETIDLEVRKLDRIPPGTFIDKKVPEGWTHVLLKSKSKLTEGDLNELNGQAFSLVELFFTGILAKVARSEGPKQYVLETVAIGLGTQCGEADCIVSPATHQRLGAGFDYLESYVFEKSVKQLDRIKHVASSPGILVFDVPNVMLLNEKHTEIVMRLGVVIDHASGQLHCPLWRIVRQKDNPAGAIDRAIWMRVGQVETCNLHVDGNELVLGIPSQKAFAATKLPAGPAFAPTPLLQRLGVQTSYTEATLAELESELRRLIDSQR